MRSPRDPELKPNRIEVPHYEQQFDFTCGPACLMMVFKHFDGGYVMNRKNETDIWRQSALAPLPPTSRYGLAFSALKHGLKVDILTNVDGIEFIGKTPRKLTGNGGTEWIKRYYGFAHAQFEERKARALELGLRERKVRKVNLGRLEDRLDKGALSILLTSARFFDDQDWAHWVVVTAADKKSVFVNDPASGEAKGRRIFSREEFDEINGYYGDQVAISISGSFTHSRIA